MLINSIVLKGITAMRLSEKHIQLIFKTIKKCWIERSLKNHYHRIYNQIIKQTDFLNNSLIQPTFFERLFCIENNISKKQKCHYCHAIDVKFNDKKYIYHKWCSPACQASDPECIIESKNTRKMKYGSENYHGVEKARKTRESKNNGNWHSKDFGNKVKETKISNGHTPNWTNTEKQKQTISEHLKENPNFWKEREAKTKQTKISNGHDANWNNRNKFKQTLSEFTDEQKKHRSDLLSLAYKSKTDNDKQDIVEKRKNTCLENYGYFPVMIDPKIREKTANDCYEQYGVSSYFQTKKCRDAGLSKKIEKTYKYLTDNLNDKPAFDITELSANYSDKFHEYNFTCISCRNTFQSYIGNHCGIHKQCPTCFPNPPAGTSHAEKEIYNFIKEKTGLQIITRSKKFIKPYELDIVIPSKKIAIEYDGLFWHSENSPNCHDKNYHKLKTELCESIGFKLLHIFEDEWLEKKQIVKSRILNNLGIYDKTVYARKCEVKDVQSSNSSIFLDQNHIQGKVNSSIRLGLYYNNELIALMTFGKCRFDKKHEWEMLRFCTKLGYHIPGAAGKLLKHFERNYHPKSLVSYADRRWSQGKLYYALGFSLDHISNPDYWYTDTLQHRYSRIMFQKHKLKNILKIFDEKKSEIENMTINGWYRIFDCGNYVFVKNY